ncbi:hypothetical protein BEL01nite_56130 [Bradyrhizobium elkanii]|nr:hypothetical protein BEL01nite_56130 [Bradyrhizobium elkanii]
MLAMMPSPSTTSTMIAPKLTISNAAAKVLAMALDPSSLRLQQAAPHIFFQSPACSKAWAAR